MRKHVKRIALLAGVVAMVWCGGLLADSARLRQDILRLHVVANSDSTQDQEVKLQVRDAIIGSLRDGLSDLTDIDQAMEYVQEMLPKLEETANKVLAAAGFNETAHVSLTEEAFPIREYDTFTLPSGVYNSLRIVIGDGQGQNWWCVVFPELCYGASSQEFVEAASTSEISGSLTGALTGEYEIRFWLLDKLGQLQNFFFGASE